MPLAATLGGSRWRGDLNWTRMKQDIGHKTSKVRTIIGQPMVTIGKQ